MEEKKIIIPQAIYKNMLEHGRSSLPFEACGLLSGNNHKINSIWQLDNKLRSDRRFFVEKRTIEKTIQEIKNLNEQVIAVYHSHPTTAPVPSVYDITNHPDNKVKMVIISYKTNPSITKCYQIEKTSYEECLFYINPSL
ncbi:M67 family metallopeptidase [Oceanobacillus profundus]|uniref:M67 family metallopeptidase n=1 Tax=Oceanobacillus profundus TaxID=372463 RepID=UPI00362A120F